MFVPVGVNIVTDAVSPSQIFGLVNVGFVGVGFTVTNVLPLRSELIEVQFASVIDKLV